MAARFEGNMTGYRVARLLVLLTVVVDEPNCLLLIQAVNRLSI